jgi:hypothetical protein
VGAVRGRFGGPLLGFTTRTPQCSQNRLIFQTKSRQAGFSPVPVLSTEIGIFAASDPSSTDRNDGSVDLEKPSIRSSVARILQPYTQILSL